MRGSKKPSYTDEELRKIVLERVFVFETDDLVRARWGLSRGALRDAKRRFASSWTIDDAVIGALHGTRGAVRDLARLAGWLDYRNHDVYSDAEVREILARLVKSGHARRTADGWAYERKRLRRARFIF